MDEFIAERVKLVRQLADIADPFTKIRLLKLAERYDEKLGVAVKGGAPEQSGNRSSSDRHRLQRTLSVNGR